MIAEINGFYGWGTSPITKGLSRSRTPWFSLGLVFSMRRPKNEKIADIIRFPWTTRLTNIAESSSNIMMSILELSPKWKGLSRFGTLLLRTQFIFYEKKTKNKKVADIIRFPLTTRLTNIADSSANLMILVLELRPG